MNEARSLSVTTVALLTVVAVFGFANVPDNLAALGLSAIPSWIVVGLIYFLPLSLILAEFSSALPGKRGGIYSYMELGLGPTWAFVGTWSYFVANLVYLQMVCSRLVINLSLAITGRDVFESVTWAVPLLGVASCLALTYLGSRGVRVFSRFVGVAGRVVLVAVFGLIAIAIGAVVFGLHDSATTYAAGALAPSLDLAYFSTFAWLLFAVSGAEAAGPYVNDTKNPQRDFPRAVVIAALLVGLLYVLGSVAVSFLLPVESINKATAVFDAWRALAGILGLPAEAFARVFMTLMVFVSIVGYVIWMESPIRAMFADVPAGTFPEFLTRRDEHGTHHQALKTQAAVVSLLILVPLLSIVAGLSGSDRFISLLIDLSSLAVVVPYLFISIAYVRARRAGMLAPFQMARSTPVAVTIGVVTLAVSAFGYLGAGLYALQAETIDWLYVATVYLGPGILIALGLWLRHLSLARAGATE
ncbi:MAG: amino acid permease [Planctomycetota bacterium]|nr:amino acid permease [Planctomycetota bacterium]